MVDLGAPAQGLGEGLRADRGDHELLDVHVGVGVRPAVQDVHHRNGQQVRVRAAQVAEERQVGRFGGGVRDGERDAEDGVGAERALVVGGVQVEHGLVDQALLGGVVADELRADLLDDGEDGLLDTLAVVAVGVTVAKLDGLEGSGGGAGRNGGTTRAAVVEADLDLDRGVASGVQDFPGYDDVDGRHEHLLMGCDAGTQDLAALRDEPNRLTGIGQPIDHPLSGTERTYCS